MIPYDSNISFLEDASLWSSPQGTVTPIRTVIHGTLYTVQARLEVQKMVRGVLLFERSTLKTSILQLRKFLS